MYWRGQYSPVNNVPPPPPPKLPWNRATTAAFQLSEGFLSWGTSFAGGGQYSRGDIFHSDTGNKGFTRKRKPSRARAISIAVSSDDGEKGRNSPTSYVS